MFRLRRHERKQWKLDNPILAKDEVGQDTTTKGIKIGDGKTRWNDLPFDDLGRRDVFVSGSPPTPKGYPALHIQTGLGEDGTGFTFWIEDGKP